MWIWLDFQIFLFVRFVRILSKTHLYNCLISYAHFQCKCMHLKRLYCFVLLRIFLLVSIYCNVLHIILKRLRKCPFSRKVDLKFVCFVVLDVIFVEKVKCYKTVDLQCMCCIMYREGEAVLWGRTDGWGETGPEWGGPGRLLDLL